MATKKTDYPKTPRLLVEDAKIAFRNFSGKEGQFNAKGDRNFCLLLTHELAEDLVAQGWNVKMLKPRDEGDTPRPYIQVKVSWRNQPPKILMVTGQGKTLLDEESVAILDLAEIETIDLVVQPYHWTVREESGIKAYLKTMYVTIVEDKFASKYYDVPDSAISGMTHDEEDED